MDKETRVTLLKQFSLILKTRAKDDKYQKLTPALGYFYPRKDLIEVLKKKHGGSIPENLNLMECENKELLSHIGDDMFLISYSTEQWSKETKSSMTSEPPKIDPPKPENTGSINGSKEGAKPPIQPPKGK